MVHAANKLWGVCEQFIQLSDSMHVYAFKQAKPNVHALFDELVVDRHTLNLLHLAVNGHQRHTGMHSAIHFE